MSRRSHASNPISLLWFQDIITSVLGIMILVTLFLALEMIFNRQHSPDIQTRDITQKLKAAAAQSAEVQAAVEANRRQVDALRRQLAGQETELLQQVRYDSDQLQRQLRDLEALNQLLAAELSDADSRRRAAQASRDELTQKDASRDADRQTLEQLSREVQEKLAELKKLRTANRVIFNLSQGDAKTPWLVELSAAGVQAAPVGKRARPETFPDIRAFLAWARQRSRAAEHFVLLVKPATVRDFMQARSALKAAGFDVGFDLLASDQTALDPEHGAATP